MSEFEAIIQCFVFSAAKKASNDDWEDDPPAKPANNRSNGGGKYSIHINIWTFHRYFLLNLL